MSVSLDFTKVKTADFADKSFDCPCGRQHNISTKHIYLGKNALSLLKSTAEKILPAGKVLFITSEDLLTPYGNIIEAELKAIGYDIVKHALPAKTMPDIKLCGAFLKAPEDVRLAVCYGGAGITDMAKYYSSISGNKLIAVAPSPDNTSYLSDTSSLYVNGIKENLKSAAPYALLCDLNIIRQSPNNALAAGFGEICSLLTSLIDWRYSKCITGSLFCENIYNLASQCADLCLNAGEGLINRSPESIDILCEALLRASVCMQLSGGCECACGGEHGLADMIELIRRKEGKDMPLYGEIVMLSLKYIINVYLHYFGSGFTDLLMPVNKALHAEKLSEIAGADCFSTLRRMDYDLSVETLKIQNYKTKEFSADFLRLLQKASKKIEYATVIFKRIYPDAGFWINGCISGKEIKTALALAPDLNGKFTILTRMRNMGIFERYLKN